MKKLFYLCIAVIGITFFSSCSSDDEDKAKEKFKEDQSDAPAPPVIKPAPSPKKKKQADAGKSAEKAEKPSYSSGTTKVDSGLAISVTTIGNNNKFTLTVNSGQGSSGNSTIGTETSPQLWEPFQLPGENPNEKQETPSINLKKKGTVAQNGFVIITDDQSAQAVFGKKSEAEVATLDE
ncbi:MAG: hypothetical protein KBC98_00200 [Candidatus Pacebacteria bacterium]|nr:hypothetical protein [Candidatus Paceibacterota bacterium]